MMKIIDERHKQNTVMFNDLGIGDCFEYNGDFYIKMYPIERDNAMYSYSAFNLIHNEAWSFANDVNVTKVNMEVIIKNE